MEFKKINIRDNTYEIITDIKEAFISEDFTHKCTEYFDDFEYIVGDWAYGKLRLKGFYNCKNKKCTNINNIEYLEKYIKNNCAHECKYFVAKKI